MELSKTITITHTTANLVASYCHHFCVHFLLKCQFTLTLTLTLILTLIDGRTLNYLIVVTSKQKEKRKVTKLALTHSVFFPFLQVLVSVPHLATISCFKRCLRHAHIQLSSSLLFSPLTIGFRQGQQH